MKMMEWWRSVLSWCIWEWNKIKQHNTKTMYKTSVSDNTGEHDCVSLKHIRVWTGFHWASWGSGQGTIHYFWWGSNDQCYWRNIGSLHWVFIFRDCKQQLENSRKGLTSQSVSRRAIEDSSKSLGTDYSPTKVKVQPCSGEIGTISRLEKMEMRISVLEDKLASKN